MLTIYFNKYTTFVVLMYKNTMYSHQGFEKGISQSIIDKILNTQYTGENGDTLRR